MNKQYKKPFIVIIAAITTIGFMLFFSSCGKRGQKGKENLVPTSTALTMAAGAQPSVIISVHAIPHLHHEHREEAEGNR